LRVSATTSRSGVAVPLSADGDGSVVSDSGNASSPSGRTIPLGRISGAFGIRGEIRIESWTDPPTAIFGYQPWTLAHGKVTSRLAGVRGRAHKNAVVASVPGVADRDAAEQLAGAEILVLRSVLPPPKAGEYYWVDLEGLEVVNMEGIAFGKVDHLLDTGANHVMVVRGERERLLPFVQPHLVSVDFDAGRIVVDWDPDF
jgi:16S rRNA processing protein RimM